MILKNKLNIPSNIVGQQYIQNQSKRVLDIVECCIFWKKSIISTAIDEQFETTTNHIDEMT